MKDRLISAVAGLLFAGMSALFGMAAYVAHADYVHESGYEGWIETPGKLRKLALQQTLHRMRWQYVVSAEYEFEFGGEKHVAFRYDLKGVVYPSHEEGKAEVEAQLDITGRANWQKVQRGSFDEWVLEARDMPVRVRHSPSDPTATALTETPPMAAWLSWLLIIAMGFLALVTALGSVALAVFTIRPPGSE